MSSFSSDDLTKLDQAFEVSWAVVQAQDPFRDFSKDDELKVILRQKLFCDGVSCIHDRRPGRGVGKRVIASHALPYALSNGLRR